MIIISEVIAFEAPRKLESSFPSGNFFEKWKRAAAPKNNTPTAIYKYCTTVNVILLLAISFPRSILALAAVPKRANDTTIGPIAVPNEFTPPARFNLWDPFSGSPSDIANGFAAVCWRENPRPTIKSAPRI